MAMFDDLSAGIQKIQGIEGYALVRQDGQVATHENIDKVDSLAASIVMTGLTGDQVKLEVGASHFKYLIISRETKEKLLVFAVDAYFLGLIQKADAYTPEVVQKVQSMIRTMRFN